MKIRPTVEVNRFDFLGDFLIKEVYDLKYDPEAGTFWVTESAQQMVFEVAPGTFEVLTAIGPLAAKPQKLDFGPDGNLYVSTLSGTVEVFGRKGAPVRTITMVKPPLDKPETAAIWAGMPAATKGYGSTGGDVLCLENELWVTDQRFAVIEVFNYSGKLLRYIWEYTQKGGKTARFSPVGELERLPDGKFLLAFPLTHYAVVVDADLKEVFTIGKRTAGFIGGFIGIHGIALLPEGDLLLTDPGVNTMQVFSSKDGSYLYHFGGPDATEDPGQPGRPFLDIGGIAFAQLDRKGDLYLYAGNEKAFVQRKVTGDPVEPKK
ncbi:MAG: hypothetical protein IH608_05115, partial [Proteobacteria bacterium]|nr:hypothetical protein [Pseudomonadota bacterium]